MNVVQIQHYLTNRIQLSLWSAWSCNVGSGVTIKGLDKVSSQQANCYFKTTCSWFKWVTQTQMQTCVQENMCELLWYKCKHWCMSHFLHYHLCLLLTSTNWDKANVSSDARWNTVISHVVCTCMLLKLRPVCQCTACINQPSREGKISAPFCAYFFFTPTHISGYSRSDITSGSNNGGGDGISTS